MSRHCLQLLSLFLAFSLAANDRVVVVQEKTRALIQTKKQISAETSDWEAEKRALNDLNELRKKEIVQIDELIAAAGSRLAEAEKQRAALLVDEQSTHAWRATVEKRLAILETGLRAQLPKFPPPLREKIRDAIERLEQPQADAPLQDRCRDAIAILAEVGNFDAAITIDSELRDYDGENVEVEVLYLGLAQAWFVDRAGKRAGAGRPGPDGWRWTDDPALAGRVREAIDIHRKQAPPALIALPFLPAAK